MELITSGITLMISTVGQVFTMITANPVLAAFVGSCISLFGATLAAVGEVRASKAVTFWDAFARGLSPAYAFLSAYLEKGKTPETATDQDWANAYGGFGGDGRGTGFVDKVNTTVLLKNCSLESMYDLTAGERKACSSGYNYGLIFYDLQ